MANYPKELLDLVQEYLTDGVITANWVYLVLWSVILSYRKNAYIMALTTLESDRLLVFKNCFCKKKDRYYAKTLSDMDTVGLLCGEQRYAARTNLEDFIDGNIS